MSKVKTAIVIVIAIALIGGYYFYLSNKNQKEDELTVTAVQNVIMRDLETNYPPTPKEVVKYYSELAKCLYNEQYTDEQLTQMADKLLDIYDDELAQNNPREQYIKDLEKEVEGFKSEGNSIVSYTPSSSTDVEKYMHEGRECAAMYCIYTIKNGTHTTSSQQEFILRKDTQSGHWKILGFSVTNPSK